MAAWGQLAKGVYHFFTSVLDWGPSWWESLYSYLQQSQGWRPPTPKERDQLDLDLLVPNGAAPGWGAVWLEGSEPVETSQAILKDFPGMGGEVAGRRSFLTAFAADHRHDKHSLWTKPLVWGDDVLVAPHLFLLAVQGSVGGPEISPGVPSISILRPSFDWFSGSLVNACAVITIPGPDGGLTLTADRDPTKVYVDKPHVGAERRRGANPEKPWEEAPVPGTGKPTERAALTWAKKRTVTLPRGYPRSRIVIDPADYAGGMAERERQAAQALAAALDPTTLVQTMEVASRAPPGPGVWSRMVKVLLDALELPARLWFAERPHAMKGPKVPEKMKKKW